MKIWKKGFSYNEKYVSLGHVIPEKYWQHGEKYIHQEGHSIQWTLLIHTFIIISIVLFFDTYIKS